MMVIKKSLVKWRNLRSTQKKSFIKSASILRLRVFAGPNGSGKSTLINKIQKLRVNGSLIDFGVYINADEIAEALLNKGVSLRKYKLELNKLDFITFAFSSGLITKRFSKDQFLKSFILQKNKILLKDIRFVENLAQLISNFLIHKLLELKIKYSFETVFSHESKLEIMNRAKNEGYKVYFYFVSTESPEINIERVLARIDKGGHYVPEKKIRSRYFRSMNFLYRASQIAYQAFYFDNSTDEPNMFANFKIVKGMQFWNILNIKSIPEWFKKYYLEKI